MNFLNPAFLWILPAAAVPVLLHMLNKRPPKRALFSHVVWLKQVHQSTMPKKRLREILLMTVRTALVLLLVFFFARPIFHSSGFFSKDQSNESMVVLLDVSASMGAVEGGREGLAWAKERLQEVLRKVPLDVKVGLVVFSDQIELELAPTDERSRLTTAVQNAKVTCRGTDVAPAIKLGSGMLSNQPAGRKTLLMVSDMAAHGWRNVGDHPKLEGLEPQTRVVLWDAVGKVANAGFSDAALQLSEEGLLKGQARVHSSKETISPSWTMRLNDRVVAQGQWSEGPLELKAQLPEGGSYTGSLALTPDAASFDDVFYMAGRVPKGFRLLLVDGESGLAPSDAETYYLRSALESPRDPRLESIDVVRPEGLVLEALEKYDAIVLANVPEPAEGMPKEAELLTWLERGGGLLITAGPKWPKAPRAPLRLFRARAWSNETETVAPPDPGAPFLSAVNGLADFQWPEIRVSQYVPLEPESAMEVVLALKNGDPLLVRKQVGKGFVMCLATSLDRAWTNFPSKPAFAPLMRELISSLADPLREETALQAWVGRPVRLRVAPGVKSVSVIAPNGVASGARVNSEGILEWPAPTVPGLYQVKTDRQQTDFNFAVNVADLEQEGDLSRLEERDAKRPFPDNPVDYVNGGKDKTAALLAALQGRDLANPILAFLFLLFGLETILGFSRKRRE